MSINSTESTLEEVKDAESMFRLVSNGMKSIMSDESCCDNDCISSTIENIQSCMQCVEREYLMSKNEMIEDIGTSTLKVRSMVHCT